jgi:acetyl/propionyl-CoA carboxylase alpha subunit
MTTFQFSETPDVRHQVQVRPDAVYVGMTPTHVRKVLPGNFAVTLDGRSERLRAVAHGDTIFVQLRGRVWKLNRVDLARRAAADATAGEGVSRAPMPGVVVSLLVARGQQVQRGEALVVIESMKLQMTISADFDGEVADLPLSAGQTFQRNDVLIRLLAAGAGSQGEAA